VHTSSYLNPAQNGNAGAQGGMFCYVYLLVNPVFLLLWSVRRNSFGMAAKLLIHHRWPVRL
jgi:hypothetical protein